MQSIKSNLVALKARIVDACRSADRDPASITLIGVSKTKPLSAVREAAALGIDQFGENYLDEAVKKIQGTADLELCWHYIGRIQSNKTRMIAQCFDWVHTVDREKIARRLHNHCPQDKQLNVLLQINVDADPAKAGVSIEQAPHILAQILSLPKLVPRGLMTILAQDSNPGASYQSMAQLFGQLGCDLDEDQRRGWDTLSMGMTADLEQAIAAGSTHIRIGTALFGMRDMRGMRGTRAGAQDH